ncbi:Cytochrome c, class I [Crocosphaera chwakensis CCY0110]|uniref:Cytochrome c, class I n=1 Tax=Crocosphaera chwakensis CCY0110 TaxID=391612 RepID=A3IXY6_9CHRO|nr:c-type cytochrome [Crocosphaera chwakensis]EAZ88655.1 Cytochrome c, class I [Crocosphaera chwakensis CCY0110]
MTEQLIQPKDAIQRIILIILGMIFLAIIIVVGWYLHEISDPYINEVLSRQGDVSRGQAIFEINCAGCHGIEADGIVGPSLHRVQKHKSKVSLIQQVISGKTPPMPKFQPSSQEMADLLSYLEKL